MSDLATMRAFFDPKSVAVVGASSDTSKIGGMILKNIIDSGYTGRLFPVNIKGGEISGMQVSRSLSEIGIIPELVILAVPAKISVTETEAAGKLGVKNAIVISAGFKEEGSEGAKMESELKATASRYGMRIVGPNCFGLMNTYAPFNSTFSSTFPSKGSISVCSQSGAIGSTILDWSKYTENGISKFVSLGNKADIDESDVIRYFGEDDDTDVIGIYSEGITNGERFMDAVRNMRKRKPIVMLKSGRSSSGSQAASSHTGALSGSDSVYNAVFDRLNIIRVKDIDEMFDALSVISLSKPMRSEGIAVVTNAGGLGVMAADASSDHSNISLCSLSSETRKTISEKMPSVASTANPVDVRGDADNNMIMSALEIISKDENVGAIAVLSSPLDTTDLDMISRSISDVKDRLGVPVTVSFTGGTECESAMFILRKGGVPGYPSPDRAIRSLSILKRAYEGTKDGIRIPTDGISGRAYVETLLQKILAEGRSSLSEDEGKAILTSYGIPVPGERSCRTLKEALSAADEIGYPVVMKIMSPDIHHKTDIGGVIVGVEDEKGVRNSFETLMSRCRTAVPSARIDGVSVQKMAKGQEVILSLIRDDQFGPVISFGLGGIYVEILAEISRSILPMSEENLDEMITSTKAYRMLSGARGKTPADIASLKEIMRKMIQIAVENPEIYELEINPVLVGKKNEGSWAVDALTTLRWDN